MSAATVIADAPQAPDLSDAAIAAGLARHLRDALGCAVQVEALRRFTGGMSWITAAFTLGAAGHALDGRRFIVKVGSPAGLMAPYSALPQARVLQALADSGVPVPALRWHSDDPAILAAPFLVTDCVAGEELNPFTRDYGIADASVLAPLGGELAQVLARLHRFDWQAAGIDTLQGEDAAQSPGIAQVQFWQARVRRWSRRPQPLMAHAAHWLQARAPRVARPVVVHGDYRVGNFLSVGPRITAMLDWEMTHLGDPHEDLAWVMLPDMRLAGLIDHEAFIAQYEAAGGLRVDRQALAYWQVFSLYKMVAINLGGESGFLSGGQDLRLVCLAHNNPSFLLRLAQAMEEAA